MTNRIEQLKARLSSLTEEAVKKATAPAKPAPKAPKILTNNPGYGYHGIADRKHKGDLNKSHAEYNKMHAKVKDWAGEAGHLALAKKPNVMVRDYLDSARGRHLEGLEADDKYIKKDFGHFARSYDPKLFVESLEEGKATHGVFTVWHAGDRKGMVIHHGGNTTDPDKAQRLAATLNASSDAFFKGKHVKEKSDYHYEARPLGKKTWMEHAGDPGDDDHSGTYSVQSRDGRYRNVRIKRQPDGKYHIHHADGSKGSTDLNGVKSYISRNTAAWIKEDVLDEGLKTWAVDKLTNYTVSKGQKDHRPDIIKDQAEKMRDMGLKHVTARYDKDHMYHKKAIAAWHAVVDHAAKAKTISEFQKRAKNIGDKHSELVDYDGPHSPLRPIKEEALNEERMEEHGGFKVGDIVTHEGSAPMHIHSINLFKGSKEPQALLGHKPAGKGRGIRHAFVSSLRAHKA